MGVNMSQYKTPVALLYVFDPLKRSESSDLPKIMTYGGFLRRASSVGSSKKASAVSTKSVRGLVGPSE
jgi:hypothetical protein